jgi:hypothetical protein
MAGGLSGLIARMMDRDRHSRWSMADAAHALRRFAEHGETHDEPTAVLTGPLAGAAHDDARDDDAARTAAVPVAAAAPARPAGRADMGDGDDRRRGIAPWLVAAAVGLLLILGVGYMMLGDDPSEEPTAASPSESPSPSESEEPSREPSPTPTPTPSPTPTPTPSETPTQEAQPENQDAAMEQSVQEYFSFVPGDTDAGWERLSPSMQAEVGRDDYEEWWGSIDSVDLARTDAVGDRQVEIDLTYYFDDGRATQETQLLTLEPSGDRYLIADDQVLSSRTVS